MKIGVIADTHLKRPDAFLRRAVEEHFDGADLILHAGDMCTLEVLEAFGRRPFKAVAGNRDDRAVKARLPQRLLIEAEGLRIGLIHGWGAPWGIVGRLQGAFEGADAVVFGHTHRVLNQMENGVLYFNPGSFKGGWIAGGVRSLGILEVGDGIRGRIIRLFNNARRRRGLDVD